MGEVKTSKTLDLPVVHMGEGEQQWDSRPSSKTHAGFESTQPYRHTTHDVNSGHYFGHKTDEKKDCIIC